MTGPSEDDLNRFEDDLVHSISGSMPAIDLREMLVRAVIQSFFQPVPLGYINEPVQMQGQAGYAMPQAFVPVMKYGESPLEQTARKIFDNHRREIIDAVVERIDMETIVTTVTEKATAQISEVLLQEDDRGWNAKTRLGTSAADIRTRVRDKIVNDIAAETRERYEAEQNEMFEAWQEIKRQRAVAAREAEARELEQQPLRDNEED